MGLLSKKKITFLINKSCILAEITQPLMFWSLLLLYGCQRVAIDTKILISIDSVDTKRRLAILSQNIPHPFSAMLWSEKNDSAEQNGQGFSFFFFIIIMQKKKKKKNITCFAFWAPLINVSKSLFFSYQYYLFKNVIRDSIHSLNGNCAGLNTHNIFYLWLFMVLHSVVKQIQTKKSAQTLSVNGCILNPTMQFASASFFFFFCSLFWAPEVDVKSGCPVDSRQPGER